MSSSREPGAQPGDGQTLVFFGNERLATGLGTTAPTLRSLIKAGYHIAAIVANYDAATSRSSRELEVATYATEHNIPLHLPQKTDEILDILKSYQASCGILAAYGKIVSQEIIDVFPKGIINIHPSLLPKYRGPTPIEQTILDGTTTTGVSIMQLVKQMDAGPVYAQKQVPLSGQESKAELAQKLLLAGGELLMQNLPGILDGAVQPSPQDESNATYTKLIKKEQGLLDWSKTATNYEREIRAYHGWPRSTCTLGGIQLTITAAHVSEQAGPQQPQSAPKPEPGTFEIIDKKLAIYCGQGQLILDKIIPSGKAEMDIQAFLNGYGHQLTK